MEPGYPKPLTSEFPGLTGPISAALMVPATRNGPETVFFFKPGEHNSDVTPAAHKQDHNHLKSKTLVEDLSL